MKNPNKFTFKCIQLLLQYTKDMNISKLCSELESIQSLIQLENKRDTDKKLYLKLNLPNPVSIAGIKYEHNDKGGRSLMIEDFYTVINGANELELVFK